jgi:diguanylate cyclase (GGDEF)-like protein
MTVRDRRADTLRLLTSTAMVVGAVAVFSSFAFLDRGLGSGLDSGLDQRNRWAPAAAAVLVAVASAAVVRVRLRSAVAGTPWTDAAILICIVVLPPAWVPLCVGVGVLVAKLATRVSLARSAYNAARDAVAAAAGVLVAWPLGIGGGIDDSLPVWAMLPVALAVAAAEHAIGLPVLSTASGTSWLKVLRTNGDIRLASLLSQIAVAMLTVWLWQIDPRLLAVIPPVVLCLHLLHASRASARAERIAWQRLAATTEELNDTDLQVVLTAAVVNAASLFSAEQAEVFLRDGPDGPILFRGDADGVVWSGDPGQAPARPYDGESVTARLSGQDFKADLGEVRLHYAGRVDLTDRERLTLRTFVSSLRTAVRNATAFAEARRLALRNAHAALHDPLTGLANRRRLHEYGDGVLSRPGVTALVVADLDLFREVNETLGHLAGDRLLAEVARRLARVVGRQDLVARLGGDEFAVLLVGLVSPAVAEQRARQLLATLDAPIDVGDMRVRIEASAGLAVSTGDPASSGSDAGPAGSDAGMVELLRQADVAMYQAKRGGPRIVYYDRSRDTADVAQLMLGGDLPRAIAEREFVVSFQPIVDLATGDMISAEALARWQHPDRGEMDPRRFLAAVERSGLLPAFAEAVLDQALAAMARWRQLGVLAPVAVNASPRSLLDPTFPRMVRDRLRSAGARGQDLIVELTETLTLSQVEMVGGVLRELRDCGVRLALDDFGTGYSSLAMLAKVPVYELKIDRSFVATMDSSPEAVAVVRSTIELGRTLEHMVVAEGVETPEQRQALWEMGCPAGQGHLFGKPMSADALLGVISAGVVPGRLCEPLHAAARNVIELPRIRRTEPDRTESDRSQSEPGGR